MLFNCCLTILIGIVLAAIFTILVAIGTIAITTPILYWVIFGISLLFLVLIFLGLTLARDEKLKRCICKKLTCLLLGIIGGIVFSIILLGVTAISTTTTLVFLFLTTASFAIEVLSFVGVIKCLCPTKCD